MIKQALNGGDEDRIIFCGSGATAAINRLIDILGLRLPRDLDERYALSERISNEARPVVFVGPYEHHSNELPWRETIAEVVRIPLCTNGSIDSAALGQALRHYAQRPLLIGSFSAASNVTGIRSDVVGITRLLKAAGALAFWDYAAAAPYVRIDLNREGAQMDAAFISTHKFVGGPGTPGILAVKAQLLCNSVPAVVGGGTVAFVTPDSHRYLTDAERREEGGTPAIIESIRAGLVFALQQRVGTDTIEELERDKVQRAMERLGANPKIDILGPRKLDRLSIFSLRFLHAGEELHYGFVTALLNDLFGIQARGGCSCAGPYGHDLLGIDEARSKALDACVAAGDTALRPGWVRVNFNYFIDDSEFEYLLSALELVAEHGWRILPLYQLNRLNGLWTHRLAPATQRASLFDTDFGVGRRSAGDAYDGILREAQAILLRGASALELRAALADLPLSEAAERERWFTLPAHVAATVLPRGASSHSADATG